MLYTIKEHGVYTTTVRKMFGKSNQIKCEEYIITKKKIEMILKGTQNWILRLGKKIVLNEEINSSLSDLKQIIRSPPPVKVETQRKRSRIKSESNSLFSTWLPCKTFMKL